MMCYMWRPLLSFPCAKALCVWNFVLHCLHFPSSLFLYFHVCWTFAHFVTPCLVPSTLRDTTSYKHTTCMHHWHQAISCCWFVFLFFNYVLFCVFYLQAFHFQIHVFKFFIFFVFMLLLCCFFFFNLFFPQHLKVIYVHNSMKTLYIEIISNLFRCEISINCKI
jgi:hypothetical protein